MLELYILARLTGSRVELSPFHKNISDSLLISDLKRWGAWSQPMGVFFDLLRNHLTFFGL